MRELQIIIDGEVLSEHIISTEMSMKQQAMTVRAVLINRFAEVCKKNPTEIPRDIPVAMDILKAIEIIEDVFDLPKD